MRSNMNFADLYAKMYPGKRCRYVTFIVTHQCNLRCTYCYEHEKDTVRMEFETAKRCVDLLFQEDAKGGDYINRDLADGLILDFIGGEPLLEIELIDQIVDYFRQKAMELDHPWAYKHMICMSTNGLLYFDPKVQAFLKKNRGRISMTVTVDGDQETHDSCRVDCNGCGSYQKAALAFQDVKERYGQYGTKFTIAPGNVNGVFRACKDMIERYDLKWMHCNCVYEEGWNNELAGILYFQLKQLADWIIDTGRYKNLEMTIFDDFAGHPVGTHNNNWCGGTGLMMAFDCDGTIYPCQRYAPLSMARRPLIRIGDVDHGIGILPEDRANIDMLRAVTLRSQSSETCISCKIGTGCGWCSAYNYEKSGDVNKRMTFICPMHQARVLATSYYRNRMYRKEQSEERYKLEIPTDWAVGIVGNEEYQMLLRLSKR